MSTPTKPYDVLIIGGGQAGLATGYHLQQTGLNFLILEANHQVGGSWPHYYDSLHLFSPAKYANLPGLPFPGDPQRYPSRDEVIAYLRTYARHFRLPVVTNAKVTAVTRQAGIFQVMTDAQHYSAPAIVAASGPFNKPYWPQLPGQDQFEGTLLHAYDYQWPLPFQNQRIIVVGAGNSAVQIAADLAPVAQVTLATREPIRWLPQRILGKDIHFWLQLTRLDVWPGQSAPKARPPVTDSGQYRAALAAGRFKQRPMFQQFTADGVRWADGSTETVDTVIMATGYRPNLTYLHKLGIVDTDGQVRQQHGVSLDVPGLYFNGLPFQRNLASATLRGSGPDARAVLKHLLPYLKEKGVSVHKAASVPFISQLKTVYCRLFCKATPA